MFSSQNLVEDKAKCKYVFFSTCSKTNNYKKITRDSSLKELMLIQETVRDFLLTYSFFKALENVVFLFLVKFRSDEIIIY